MKLLEYVNKNITFFLTVLEAIISLAIMICWGAFRYPTGMTNRRERILFNHTSTAFSLTAGGIIFDHMMGNSTPHQLQLVYSSFGAVLYGTVLVIQFFNIHHFKVSEIIVMMVLHLIAAIIFIITAVTIFTTKRTMAQM